MAYFRIDEIPEHILPELIPDSLHPWKVGQVQQRFSKTEAGSYISNGCVQCDALQGRFFSSEIMHRLQPITEYPVTITKPLSAAINACNPGRWRVSNP